jgi:hypothetical protein
MSAEPDYLQRAINAERIASVIAHRYGHSFAKHKDEFGGDIKQYRQAIVDTLTDPKTIAVKCDIKDYRFYNKERNVLVLIDPQSPDWGTAFSPNGNRGMQYMRERGVPLNENGNVTYLNKLNSGFFERHDRLHQQPAPIQLNTLTAQQSAEVLLSIFDRVDNRQERSNRLCNAFNAASLHVMPDMIAKIRALPGAEMAVLRDCAAIYKQSSRDCAVILNESGLAALKYPDGRGMDVAAILRNPADSAAFIADLEDQFANSSHPDEESRLEKMLEACETFSIIDVLRQDALDKTAAAIQQMQSSRDAAEPVRRLGEIQVSTGINR